ncbi:hypothetical protein CKAH01_03459 [Colletotrichum kahawae]|uniref:Uncharacterized protein n=1 Tax=Colletotrichum kahawae TaxID=34407 RepID=A0AAE0DCC8_COLKA|nr:hypothetical protein CKAH01_03459 [Colletotrichum kahawae]
MGAWEQLGQSHLASAKPAKEPWKGRGTASRIRDRPRLVYLLARSFTVERGPLLFLFPDAHVRLNKIPARRRRGLVHARRRPQRADVRQRPANHM